ncbi:MAG: hypothetical protein JSV84_06800 [Gemmatimonadota bacterium]|nr:MAG: hypothetical protein JSV84_06800 [Gemmatimonadota bacterium]
MDTFYFDFRDVFRAARIGLSGKKMWTLFLSLALAHFVYLVLGYLALLASGFSLQTIWGSYGLFPVAVVDQFAWYSWLLFGAAIILCIIIFLFASAIVARITFQQLKGDELCAFSEAYRFSKRHWKAVVVTPFSYIVIVAFIVLCGLILGLVARIPYVGELGFSIFLVPIVFVAIFIVFMAVVAVFSFILSPAIVATAGEDTMETGIQNFSIVWSQTWRLVVYEAILKATTAVGFYVLSLITFIALVLTYWVCGLFMGPKMAHIASKALGYLPASCPFFENFTQYFWIPSLSPWLPTLPIPGKMGITGEISAIICGVSLVLVMWGVVSYSWSTLTAGQAIIYLILRKKKDDENLLDREEEEEDKSINLEGSEARPGENEEGGGLSETGSLQVNENT